MKLPYYWRRRLWLIYYWFAVRYRRVSWVLRGKPIPKIDDLVFYGSDSFELTHGRYRVSSWLRIAVKPKFNSGDFTDDLREILYDSCQEICGHRMQWCLPEEATHVSLKGIGGAIAPISDVYVQGNANFSKEIAESHFNSAMRRGQAHEMIF